MAASDHQHGGDHYHKLKDYQPWDVLRHWLTPEEYRGWMKGNAIVYLARERDKAGTLDIKKAGHHLEKLLETLLVGDQIKPPTEIITVCVVTDTNALARD